MLHVSSKQNGALFEHISKRFGINFLKNVWEFNRGVTWDSKLKWDVSNTTQNVTVLWIAFFSKQFLHLLLECWAESILINTTGNFLNIIIKFLTYYSWVANQPCLLNSSMYRESIKVLEWSSYPTIGFWVWVFKIQGKQLMKVRKKKALSSKGVVNNFAIKHVSSMYM